MSYTPLHLHTTFSVLDSIIKIPELVKRLKELEISSCAITDHGNLHGAIDFYSECDESGIKPILGMEAYITEDPDNSEEKKRDNFHLVLLAKNEIGWKNLVWLSGNAYLNNFYYRPRIYRPLLEERSEGLVALSACLAGYPARMLRWESSINKIFLDRKDDYVRVLKWFQEVFHGDYYLEIQEHNAWEQREYNHFLAYIAKGEGFPLTITSDAHYLRKQDSATHELMMAMQLKKTLVEYQGEDHMKYYGTNYVKSNEEMIRLARQYDAEAAVENTNLIAEKCDFKVEFGKTKLPRFPIEDAEDLEEFKEWRRARTKL